jgi:hypothetical protein
MTEKNNKKWSNYFNKYDLSKLKDILTQREYQIAEKLKNGRTILDIMKEEKIADPRIIKKPIRMAILRINKKIPPADKKRKWRKKYMVNKPLTKKQNNLIKEHIYVVRIMLKKITRENVGRYLDLEELESNLYYSLVKATMNFKENNKATFKTYLYKYLVMEPLRETIIFQNGGYRGNKKIWKIQLKLDKKINEKTTIKDLIYYENNTNF